MRNRVDRVGVSRLDRTMAMRNRMYEVAKRARWETVTFAPYHRGFYVANLYVRRGKGTRAFAMYGSHDFKALWIEHGNVKVHRYAPLRRAARALGLRLKGEHPL